MARIILIPVLQQYYSLPLYKICIIPYLLTFPDLELLGLWWWRLEAFSGNSWDAFAYDGHWTKQHSNSQASPIPFRKRGLSSQYLSSQCPHLPDAHLQIEMTRTEWHSVSVLKFHQFAEKLTQRHKQWPLWWPFDGNEARQQSFRQGPRLSIWASGLGNLTTILGLTSFLNIEMALDNNPTGRSLVCVNFLAKILENKVHNPQVVCSRKTVTV